MLWAPGCAPGTRRGPGFRVAVRVWRVACGVWRAGRARHAWPVVGWGHVGLEWSRVGQGWGGGPLAAEGENGRPQGKERKRKGEKPTAPGIPGGLPSKY